MLRIDAHHHLWRYHEDEYVWIGDDMQSLRRDFLLDDLRAAMRTANVAGTIAVQARQSVEETRWLLNLAEAEDSPLLGVVGWLPIAADDFESQLETFRDHPRFKGLRHVVQGEPDGFLASKDFNRGIRALAGTGLVYEILIYARQLSQAIDFVDAHPEQAVRCDYRSKSLGVDAMADCALLGCRPGSVWTGPADDRHGLARAHRWLHLRAMVAHG
jgi:L-fuconolactonase